MVRQSLPSRALPSRAIDREPQKAYRGSITLARCSPVAPATGFLSLRVNERSTCMFTRVVEITTKTGKSHELANTIQEKVLPILNKQNGFVDDTVLTSDMQSTRVLALSFWKKNGDAE